MMQSKLKLFPSFFTVLFLLASCGLFVDSNPISIFDDPIAFIASKYKSGTVYDNLLEITADPSINTFRPGDNINLVVENTSQEDIWFPKDGFVEIYKVDFATRASVPLRDKVLNDYSTDFVMSPNSGTVVTIDPEFEELINEKVELYVFLIGKTYENGSPSDEIVIGFVHVILEP